MIYKAFKDISLSRLGMGTMRLPVLEDYSKIDKPKAQEIFDYAMANGINYFDTAYPYHDGFSERFVGEGLVDKYPRDSFYLATKFYVGANPDVKAVFEEQLERTHAEYFDFYLLHAVGNMVPPQGYLAEELGTMKYLNEQKAAGRIRNFGFSFHGTPEQMQEMLDYGDWDFIQIQLNYLDWNLQNAKKLYEMISARNIPIIVMEPVRGGRLASLSDKANAALRAKRPDWSISSWAFRWLMRLDGVQVILSGMTTLDQITDNITTFNDRSLTDEEADFLMQVCDDFRAEISVPCTKCRYCCSECPMGIEIPDFMEKYNSYKVDGERALRNMTEAENGPFGCIACGACMAHCPQSINIPQIMAELTEVRKKLK